VQIDPSDQTRLALERCELAAQARIQANGTTPDQGAYDLRDVPYVMYYGRGYGIHRTYLPGLSYGTVRPLYTCTSRRWNVAMAPARHRAVSVMRTSESTGSMPLLIGSFAV
jgi:hypothetical protein